MRTGLSRSIRAVSIPSPAPDRDHAHPHAPRPLHGYLPGVESSLAPALRRAVVTGGAGFVGSALVDRLVDEGVKVLVIDDLSTGRLEHLTDARRRGDVQFHQIDVCDPLLGEVFDRFDPLVVFHLAAQSHAALGRRDPAADGRVNYVGALNVVEAARRAAAARIVYLTSGVELYGPGKTKAGARTRPRPNSPGGVAAVAVREYLAYVSRTTELDHVMLGTSTVYGPRQGPDGSEGVVSRIAEALLAGERPRIFGDRAQTRDLVFVGDVADAAVRAATRGGGSYLNIAAGVKTRLDAVALSLARLAGSTRRPEFLAATDEDPVRSAFDVKAAADKLGWQAWTSLDDGLADTVRWFTGR